MLDDNRGGTMLGIFIIGLFSFMLGALSGVIIAPDGSDCIEAYDVTLQDHRDLLVETAVTLDGILYGYSYDISDFDDALRTAERSYDELQETDCG